MRPTTSGFALGLALCLSGAAEPPASQEEPAVSDEQPRYSFHKVSDLVDAAQQSGEPWQPFLDVPSLRAGIYQLPKGARDGQGPRELDEVYHVVRGRATFEVEGERRPVGPGDVLYVARKLEHRFVEIEEDLVVLVVFPKGQAAGDR